MDQHTGSGSTHRKWINIQEVDQYTIQGGDRKWINIQDMDQHTGSESLYYTGGGQEVDQHTTGNRMVEGTTAGERDSLVAERE